jgi:hypothetical protein
VGIGKRRRAECLTASSGAAFCLGGIEVGEVVSLDLRREQTLIIRRLVDLAMLEFRMHPGDLLALMRSPKVQRCLSEVIAEVCLEHRADIFGDSVA